MKNAIAIVILVLAAMTTMADESQDNGKVQLDTSAINAKLEQVLNDRLRTELAESDSELVQQANSNTDTNLLLQTMQYFKVDTSLPE